MAFRPIRDAAGKIVDFEYTSANETAIKFLGFNPIGQRVLEAFPSSPETGMFNQYVEALETGKPLRIEHNFAGMLVGDPWLRIVAVPTDEGLTVGMNDITEVKRAEEALRKSESLLAEAQELAHLGNWEVEIGKGAAYYSDEACRLLGIEPGVFGPSAKKFFELIHPDDRTRVGAELNRYLDKKNPLSSELPLSSEHRVIRPDGAERTLLYRWQIACDDPGQATRMFGTVQDVTETRLAEQALQESHDELVLEVEQRRQTSKALEQVVAERNMILENVKISINLNKDRRILRADPAFEKMFGWNPEEHAVGT